jgi:SAM-dependent methyltransferase
LNAPENVNLQIAKHYDDQPYTSNAFFYSSPGHLRAAAHLYGVSTVPLARARVLELGCAAGGNLLPFALAYPEARVVGVDLSPVQIAAGQKIVQGLGVSNLALHAMSLTDITRAFGEFDYIIAHGIFSWVPPEVRDAMLRVCRENLSPEGIAYISYNTYPGWKAGDIVRDAMMLHSHGAQSEDEKLARAKAMLTLLSDGLAAGNPLAPSLRGAVGKLKTHSDYYIAHEYLETFNTPCYFVEFADAARQAGLAYVGDAEAQSEMSATYGNNVQLNHSLVAMGQPKELRQQYLDFAIGRNFRKSLLVHEERQQSIAVSPELERLSDLRFAGYFTRVEADANTQANSETYADNKGRKLHTREQAVIAVMKALSSSWPASISMAELVAITVDTPSVAGETQHAADIHKAVATLFKLGRLYVGMEAGAHEAKPPMQLLSGFAYLVEKARTDALPIGLFSAWHDTVNIRLKDAEAYAVSQMSGKLRNAGLRKRLRDALHEGIVSNTDGKLLTGQRNLDATAQRILNHLYALLTRQGVLSTAGAVHAEGE